MEKIKKVSFNDGNVLNEEQLNQNVIKRLPPSGSGSGDGSSRVVKGEGEAHLTPTSYSVGDYSWDFDGAQNGKQVHNSIK